MKTATRQQLMVVPLGIFVFGGEHTGGEISLAFDDFGCWFVFLSLRKLPKLESNSHQKPYKFPLPILVGTKALLGIWYSIHVGFVNHSSTKVKTEQSLSAVKAEIPSRLSALKSKSMKLLMATKVPSLGDDGGLSTSSKGKVPPPQKRGWSKVCFGGDGWFVEVFRSFREGLQFRVWLNQIRFEIKVPIEQNKSFQVRISDPCHEKIEGYKHGLPCFSTSFMANTKTTSQRKAGPCCWCLGTGHCEGPSPSGVGDGWYLVWAYRMDFWVEKFPDFYMFFFWKASAKKMFGFFGKLGWILLLYYCTTPWLEELLVTYDGSIP